MRITSIQISNYKGFPPDETRIPKDTDFSPGLNLFVGPNASGKTTLINALRFPFRRDTVTSQGHTTMSGQRKDRGAPAHDFYDPSLPFEIRANYEGSPLGRREHAEATCERPGARYERSIETADQAAIGVGRSTLRNRVFGPGWPRHLSDLNCPAFEGDAVRNLELFRRPGWWSALQEITRRFFGFVPSLPYSAIEDITDEAGRPLIENSDGLAHILYLLLEIEKHNKATVFLIEEPDLYLHPGIQRQFVEYLSRGPLMSGRHQFFITTHSPYVINAALALKGDANLADPGVFKMSRRNGRIACEHIGGGTAQWDLLQHLGHRPSDVLQVNGIIWVEGPSDKVYLRTWLDLYAAAGRQQIRWGLDAEILWYGGAMLAHLGVEGGEFWGPVADEDCERLLNITRLSHNGVIVIDRDTETGKKWDTKCRVKTECEQRGMLVWITSEREIEYYRSDAYRDSWLKSKGKVQAAHDYCSAVLRNGEPLERVVAETTDGLTRIAEVYDRIRSWAA